MNSINSNSLAIKCNQMANEYDNNKETHKWHGPSVAFGLAFEYINSDDYLLDIGIGTGLGSLPFNKVGLKIYGMDLSSEMIKICQNKNFTDDLKLHDLMIEPYPYNDSFFHHIISIGVLNHFENLFPVFNQSFRLLKNNGIFTFIVMSRNDNENFKFEVEHAGSKHIMFRHSTNQIDEYLSKTNFVSLKELEFIISGHNNKKESQLLKTYVVRKN